ncbi:protein FAR-RED IMPAIRED RESPONSE 1-like [Chenopodium quinoa]|uniref:protein FAR-RED IMPAIRED RESPONSE 1-like n=1 Tax=Chenopodium quinoa TaxID=63459 RepID=UPI000B796B8D|nr:protein FAR-RED IMPAIRED RESPONSE 1-like [Chenopodium quinoa]
MVDFHDNVSGDGVGGGEFGDYLYDNGIGDGVGEGEFGDDCYDNGTGDGVGEGEIGDDLYCPNSVDDMSLDMCVPPMSPIRDGQCSNVIEYRSPIKTVVSTNRDVEKYYKQYGEQEGFGVSRVQATKLKVTNERLTTTWKCECWGAPNMRAKREAKNRAKSMDVAGCGDKVNGVIGADKLSRGKRKLKKCECGATIYVGVNAKGDWEVRKVINVHTHDVNPSMSKLVKEYRMKNYTANVKKVLLNFYEEGVYVSKICKGLLHEKEEEEFPSFKDMQHEVYKAKRLKFEGGDANPMMTYFEWMQEDNQNFYHTHRLDEFGRLKDVLCVDARSRAAYEYFGDVVCFDATYLTNQYELPFVNFVGVNHHGQSILLGCALVSRETTETYKWVFQQWLACMENRAPVAILTDQAALMRNAVAQTMPTARHRWCIWYIVKKFSEKLGKCKGFKDFKSPLKAIIYESFTVEEFDRRWCECMKKFSLEDNEWLVGLYEERHMWIPAFMREYFWVRMKTTQRVESINNFFDGFVNRKMKLCEFPMRYTRAMTKRVQDENEADAKATKYIRRLVSGFRHEAFFQKIYTDAKFQEIQRELSRLM